MMNSKTVIRLVIAVVVAVIGAWQFQSNSSKPEPKYSTQGKSNQRDQQAHQAGAKNQSHQTGDFDYYLISLSWSPAYCATHPNDKRQCSGRGFGFVLHGLWPQKSSGGYPENCPVTSQPSPAMIQKTLGFMPSERLIQHEWTKHGTCTGLSADEYLSLADRSFSTVRIPKGFEAPESSRSLSAEQIIGEFVKANPGLDKHSLSLRCSGNEFEEVRVCVDKQLKPMVCGKGIRSQCGRDTVQIRSIR